MQQVYMRWTISEFWQVKMSELDVRVVFNSFLILIGTVSVCILPCTQPAEVQGECLFASYGRDLVQTVSCNVNLAFLQFPLCQLFVIAD